MTAEEIATEFGISLAEVYAALAYYYDHRDELERQAAADDARLAAYAAGDSSSLAEQIRTQLLRAWHGQRRTVTYQARRLIFRRWAGGGRAGRR